MRRLIHPLVRRQQPIEGGTYLRLAEYAKKHFLSPDAVAYRIRKKKLKATKRKGKWWVLEA
jgi:hypothetical protein